jgi:pyruvate kinase
MIYELAVCGMDVARLNFSHGTHEQHLARLEAVRAAQAEVGRPIAVLGDLCGPKIRVTGIVDPIRVEIGDELVLTDPDASGSGAIAITLPGLATLVDPGAMVLIDDGRVSARVIATDGARLVCRVEAGGTISQSKGVNLPGTNLPMPALTAKDENDLSFALAAKVDYVALSFVRTARDVEALRRRVDAAGSAARIISKIEKAEAIENLDAIVAASDAVMVARGDLGVEIGVSQVPLLQKRIILTARRAGRAVITATQMLESMINEPEPTRAEVSDVANAILDGTSAVMLSAETAAGKYPLHAVRMMDSIAKSLEPSLVYERSRTTSNDVGELMTHAACDLADDVHASAIAVTTETGATARRVSNSRPNRPILAASRSERVLRQLALEWAVVPVPLVGPTSVEDEWEGLVGGAVRRGLAGGGDTIVLTGRSDASTGHATTHLSVHRVDVG